MRLSATFRLEIIRCSIPLIAATRPLRVRSTIISLPNHSIRHAPAVWWRSSPAGTPGERANLIGAIRLPNTGFQLAVTG
jgi:hypothetical protein